ncbi:MAG: UDP-N-acetylmuramoyl-tripeptide--D-alanyl-D-alanine ligase [Pseudomonadota bacterium]
MNSVSAQELANYIPDARLVGDNVLLERCCLDSREVANGDLFVALIGDRFDAHDFIADVVKQGVSAVLVSREMDVNVPQIVVPDTLSGLGYVAKFNREQFVGIVVGLTGSAGKTTCKEMLISVLSHAGRVLATQGNLNNEIGVPKTLLALSDSYQFAVVEMGAAKAFDIRYLMEFVQPQVGLLLNALPAHIEGFGDLECVSRTKSEIINELNAESIGVINLDSQFSEEWLNNAPIENVFTYSQDDALILVDKNSLTHVHAENITLHPLSTEFDLLCLGARMRVTLNVPGAHNVSNALAVAAVACSLDMPLQKIVAGLEQFTAVQGRMSQHEGIAGSRLIDDSYNANPQAMNQAIDVLSEFDGVRVLVMGDMAELGATEEEQHRACGDYAIGKIDAVWTVGSLSEQASTAFGDQAIHFESQDALIEWAQSQLTEQHTLLVKGSRSAKMDQIVNRLQRK